MDHPVYELKKECSDAGYQKILQNSVQLCFSLNIAKLKLKFKTWSVNVCNKTFSHITEFDHRWKRF